MADAQPALEHGRPAFIVGARGQLRHIVGGSIGFDAGDFAKIVDRMGSVAGAAAYAQYEQSAARSAGSRQQGHEPIDGWGIDFFNHLRHFIEKLLCKGHRSSENCVLPRMISIVYSNELGS